MTMRSGLFAWLASGILAAAPALATELPADFAARAAMTSLFELRASELALARSQDGDVKELARLVLADQQKAQRDLQAAAKTSQLPPPPDRLDADHQAKLNALKAQADTKFDKADLNLQADVDTQAIALFSDYSANGAPGAMKTFATAALPVLQAQMQRVHDFTIH